jgi:hypothetical protein
VKVGTVVRALRIVIFIALLWAIDYTRLDIYRLIAHFHLGVVGGYLLAMLLLILLWKFAGWLTGVLLILLTLIAYFIPERDGVGTGRIG